MNVAATAKKSAREYPQMVCHVLAFIVEGGIR